MQVFGLPFYVFAWNFFIYGICGWIYETIYESIRANKLVNRGFLTGPLIPIYGLGANFLYYFMRPFTKHPSILFLAGMIFCTAVEYMTSVILEKIFHAQWWTYEYFQFNFQSRIALVPSLFWGYMTLLDFDILQPDVFLLIRKIPLPFGWYALYIMIGVLFFDVVFSVISSLNFSKEFRNLIRERLAKHRHSTGRAAEAGASSVSGDGSYSADDTAMDSDIDSEDFDNKILESDIDEDTREKHFRFLKPTLFTNNKRIFDAFPDIRVGLKKTQDAFSGFHYVNVRKYFRKAVKRHSQTEKEDSGKNNA